MRVYDRLAVVALMLASLMFYSTIAAHASITPYGRQAGVAGSVALIAAAGLMLAFDRSRTAEKIAGISFGASLAVFIVVLYSHIVIPGIMRHFS